MNAHVLVTGRVFPHLASTVALLESDGRHVLVDSGAGEDAPRLLRALADHGLRPADVDTVVSTHLHYDHCGNHLLFAQADYLVSATDYHDAAAFTGIYHADPSPEKEATMEALRARTETIKTFYLRSIVREVARNIAFYDRVLAGDARFVVLTGGHRVTEEIEVIPTPGHTRGHLSVVAHGVRISADGHATDVLLAGDALATRSAVVAGGDRSIDLAADVEEYRRTRRSLLDRFRYIVLGHDTVLDTRAAVPVPVLTAAS